MRRPPIPIKNYWLQASRVRVETPPASISDAPEDHVLAGQVAYESSSIRMSNDIAVAPKTVPSRAFLDLYRETRGA